PRIASFRRRAALVRRGTCFSDSPTGQRAEHSAIRPEGGEHGISLGRSDRVVDPADRADLRRALRQPRQGQGALRRDRARAAPGIKRLSKFVASRLSSSGASRPALRPRAVRFFPPPPPPTLHPLASQKSAPALFSPPGPPLDS